MGHDPEMNRRNTEPGREQSAPRLRLTSPTAQGLATVVFRLSHVELERQMEDRYFFLMRGAQCKGEIWMTVCDI